MRFDAVTSWALPLVMRRPLCMVATLCLVAAATSAVTLAVIPPDHLAAASEPFDGLPYGSATSGAPAPGPVRAANPPVLDAPASPHTASAPAHRPDRPTVPATAALGVPAPPPPTAGTGSHRPGLIEPHLPAPAASLLETVGWLIPGGG
ncbi:MAG TPA: hypothetical protein VGL20_08160 [Candidatus Dormibacteraeota bacterium]